MDEPINDDALTPDEELEEEEETEIPISHLNKDDLGEEEEVVDDDDDDSVDLGDVEEEEF